MTDSSISAFKQKILKDFNNRPNYDKSEFHRRASSRLVEMAKLGTPERCRQILKTACQLAIAIAAPVENLMRRRSLLRLALCVTTFAG